MKKTKKWERPKLVALLKWTEKEAVLTTCKTFGQFGPSGFPEGEGCTTEGACELSLPT